MRDPLMRGGPHVSGSSW